MQVGWPFDPFDFEEMELVPRPILSKYHQLFHAVMMQNNIVEL